MLTIAKLKRWSINYYIDTAKTAQRATTDRARAGGGLGEYYSEHETRTPVWLTAGDGHTAARLVGLTDVERAGGEADAAAVARWLDDGVAPGGAHGRAFGVRGVHGFDLTFCAPKSVSLVRALRADDVGAKAITDAHTTALAEAMQYLSAHAGYTRVHNPVTGGLRFAPAAAGVAGKLLGLDRRRLAHALALAACDGPVPSVRQAVYSSGGPSMAKNNYAASATAGVTAAFLAQEGITGPLDIFDSTGGFASLTGTDQWRPAELTSGRVHVNEVESKPYSCCRKIHAALDALRELQSRHGFSHDDVLAVTLVSSGWSAGDCFANPRPQQIVDVQFSAAFCAALVMHGVPTGVDWFTPTVLSDEAVHATSRKVQLKAPSNAMPAETHSWWTEVEVRTTSGMHACTVSTPKGSPGNPMTDEELHNKWSSLVAPVLGADRATTVYEAVMGRNSNVDARGLSALLAMNTSASV